MDSHFHGNDRRDDRLRLRCYSRFRGKNKHVSKTMQFAVRRLKARLINKTANAGSLVVINKAASLLL
jgi:hypothetical protein